MPEKVLKSKTRYEPVFCIEKALDAVISCEPIDKKIKQAEKKDVLLITQMQMLGISRRSL